jgi:hypothetical protein
MTEDKPIDNQADFQRFLGALIEKFPVEFTVAKGGTSVRLNLFDNGRWIVLDKDGTKWEYE